MMFGTNWQVFVMRTHPVTARQGDEPSLCKARHDLLALVHGLDGHEYAPVSLDIEDIILLRLVRITAARFGFL